MNAIVPRCEIEIRPATLADVPFMDRLQKMHGKSLGYFPTKQFEGYVQSGGVLIAQEGERPIGYCISRDRYLKRDELGVIFQLCVEGGAQRKLVGAALVREAFARSAYGCKLYCCWCAQDLEANYFWESLGFVPIAFRAGGGRGGKKGKGGKGGRVHIFWQRRIGADDGVGGATPYWYPFQTSAGAIREDRLVFPIAPGVHWKDVQAVALPRDSGVGVRVSGEKQKRLPASSRNPIPDARNPKKVAIIVGGRIKYIDRPGHVAQQATQSAVPTLAPKKPKPKRTAAKIDPKYLAAGRELRDRYLEQFNSGLVLGAGKYDVARALQGPLAAPAQMISEKLLPAA